MIDSPVKPVTFAESVLLRPAMYTLRGTCVEVVAFLEGYHSGMAKSNPYAPPVLEWEAFRVWLAGQLGVATADAFAAFTAHSSDDRTALTQLAEYLAQFHASRPGQPLRAVKAETPE